MRLGGRTTNPGDLRTPITLLRRVSVETGGPTWPGAKHEDFAPIADVKAAWTNVHGSEAWTAASLQVQEPATVRIRYRSDVDQTCAVKKKGVIYQIISIDNIQERNEYLELKVSAWRPG
jgi:SPP1 family predicted phage head-tail adaptor